MVVSGFNSNLQVAVSIQLQSYGELIELAMAHMKCMQDRFIGSNLIKSQMYMTNINTTLIRWFCFKIYKDNNKLF